MKTSKKRDEGNRAGGRASGRAGGRASGRAPGLPCWVIAFFVNLAVALLAIAPSIIRNNGYMAMSHDFAAQEMVFHMFMNDTVKSGNLLWNWGIDLGGNFLESFSFYNIGSVFFWITLLFPAEHMSRVLGWMIILKFGVAGATSAAFLSRYVQGAGSARGQSPVSGYSHVQGTGFSNGRLLVIFGSLLYAFSGYHCGTVVFYHFQDMVALFPLLLIGLEILVEEKKRGRLILACVLNLLCNYVFFVGEVIFLVIYYVFKYLIPQVKALHVSRGNQRGEYQKEQPSEPWKEQLRRIAMPILDCFAEGAIGVAISGALLLPAVNGTITNTRVSEHLAPGDWLTMHTTSWLLLLKAVLLPAEQMNDSSVIIDYDWMSNMAYLPMVGLTFVLAYVFTKKDWLSGLLKFSLLLAVVPILNNMFTLFSKEIYRRWYFMPILIMALVSVKVLENWKEYRLKAAVGCMAGLYGLFFVMLYADWDGQGNHLIFHESRFYFGAAVALLGLGVTFVILKWGAKWRQPALCVMTGLWSSIVLGAAVYGYQVSIDNTGQDFKIYNASYAESVHNYLTEIPLMLEEDILPYRYYFDEGIGHTYYNLSMAKSLPSINSFISTPHSSVMEFYEALGVRRLTWTNEENTGTRELLGARYIVSIDQYPDETFANHYTLRRELTNSNGQIMYLYENENALPIGFTYDTYITKSQFLQLDPALRAGVMLRTLVVEDEDAANVSAVLRHYSEEAPATLREGRESGTGFAHSDNHFETVITADTAKYAFFSVPYDKSWQATVNGQEQEVLNINGLMAVKVSQGENTISFDYQYKPLRYGMFLSIAGLGLCALYLYIFRESVTMNSSYQNLSAAKQKRTH